MKRLTKKRLHWVAALAVAPVAGPLVGQKHHDRWPCRHPWKNCRCLGNLTRPTRRTTR
ncbi:MAG TPA: hypothetical protein VGE43_04530 [Acidimicrobiales bacterium]